MFKHTVLCMGIQLVSLVLCATQGFGQATSWSTIEKLLTLEEGAAGQPPLGWYSQAGVTMDGTVFRRGRYSVRVERTAASRPDEFTFAQIWVPVDFSTISPKVLELRGWIKTENTTGAAAFYFGEYESTTAPSPLAFNTVQGRGIVGTNDWKQYSTTIPLAASATALKIGFLLVGTGKAWFDGLELYADGVPVTQAPVTSTNVSTVLGFENGLAGEMPSGWQIFSPGIVLDDRTFHSGRLAARIDRSATSTGQFSFGIVSIPIDFTGRIIEVRSFIRTQNVSNSVAVYGSQTNGPTSLAFATTQGQGVRGTTEWKQYSASAALVPGATTLTVGILLNGTGTVWFDDIEILVDGTPVSRAQPKNPVLLTLSPKTMQVGLAQGTDAAPVPFSIAANRNGVPVTLTSNVAWLRVDQAQVTTPAMVNALVSARSLSIGSYTGIIRSSSPLAPEGTITVTLTVTGAEPPKLTVSPREISRTVEIGAGGEVRLRVANTGNGVLRFTGGLRFDGVSDWITTPAVQGALEAGQSTEIPITLKTQALAPGTYRGQLYLSAAGLPEEVVLITVQAVAELRPRILLSQVGYSFTAVALGGAPGAQSLGVLNEGSGSLTYEVRAITLGGGDWLRLSSAGDRIERPLRDVSFLDVSVDPSGLQPGDYYGRVEVTSGEADNTPQIATVLLKVLPPGSPRVPEVRPAGMVFISEEGADPASQTARITNLESGNLGFVSGPLTSDRGPWLQYTPDIGQSTMEQPAELLVQPQHRNLGAAVRTGAINLLFTDTGETRAVRVLSVVAPRGRFNPEGKRGQRMLTGCPGATIRMQHLTLENAFVAVAGEPTDIRIRVIDDCGTPLTPDTAAHPLVSITSDTGDEVRLTHVQNGEWRGTWRPRAARELATVAITIIAGDLRTPAEILLRTGRVLAAGSMPVVRSGALRHSATLQTNVPVAPGHLISILGSGLADKEEVADTLPLPRLLADTEVILGGRPLALLYTSNGQINAQIPYDLPANTEQQLYVRRGRTLSVPERFMIAPAQPGIFTVNQQGFGQGFVLLADGVTVADPKSPAERGSEVILYASGLGAVTPNVEAGEAAPNPPPRVVTPLEVIIGGMQAKLLSATLSPGVTGRYEVRVEVPTNAPIGNEIPVLVRATDRVSPVVTMAIR
ncbi:MAG: hypothetical protein JNK87_04540 [Bryobacterales bacterium]|nr:hypothetical protein [Bryobacterales bacterium]